MVSDLEMYVYYYLILKRLLKYFIVGSSVVESVYTRDKGDKNKLHEKHILSNDQKYDKEKIISRLEYTKTQIDYNEIPKPGMFSPGII